MERGAGRNNWNLKFGMTEIKRTKGKKLRAEGLEQTAKSREQMVKCKEAESKKVTAYRLKGKI